MRKRPSPSVRPGKSSPVSIVALEKRIAFDGAAAATAAKVVHKAVSTDAAPHAATDAARDLVAAHRDSLATRDTGRDTATGRADGAGAPQALRGLDLGTGDGHAPARAAPSKSVVFIESDVPDIAGLIKDVDHSAQIVLLDASKDGVDAIATYLAAHRDVKDVYIFSHGSDAQLDLGSATLDAASMTGRYAGDLATIKASLAPGANILVYGCDFALGTQGDSAAHLLSQLTGAAVAASTDLTGGAAQGGNFVLEDRVGAVDAPDVLSTHVATDYVGLLAAAPTTIFANAGTGAYHANIEFLQFANTSLASGGITNGATATYTTAAGSTVTVTFSNVSNATDAASFKPAALSAYSPSKFYGGYNNTAATSALLYGQYNDTASFTVTFSAKDKNGNTYTPNIAFADGEVTQATGEFYTVTTNGGSFQNVETIGTNDYTLKNNSATSITLSNTVDGVPLLVTDNATSLNITTEIAGGKEGFVLALVDPTLSLDANASSGASAGNYQTTFTEKGAAVSVSDTDVAAIEPGGTAASAKIVLTNAQAGDVLALAAALPSGITSSTDTSVAGQITVTLSGASSLANYQTAIHDVTFANTSSDPSTADRNIAVTYNDGGQNSNVTTSTIHVVAVNDAPVETAPGAQSTNKDTALSISGLSVSDVDANGATETVTLSVSDGTLTLKQTTGLTFSKGTGTNDTTETFTGTLASIDSALNSVKYQPTTGYVGSDTLNFSTNDNGNTGTGGALTASKTVGITVNNVNPTAKGTIANQKYTDGQANISVATSQAFTDSLGLTLTYSATGLPKGLTLDPTTGQITGTIDHDASKVAPQTTGSGATLDGTYSIVETASDGQGGSTTQRFTIDSTNQAPVVGTTTAKQTNNDGDTINAVNAAAAFSDPNGDPLTYTATGLPPGLSISTAGVITGTIPKNVATKAYTVVVTATDDKSATSTETFTWQINDVPPVPATALANQTYNDGQPNIAIATSQGFSDANGNTLTYAAAGLPAGLTIDTTTGKITGTIDHDASKNAPSQTGSGATLDGKYTVTVTASDGLGGSAVQSFTIDSKNQAPVVGTATANQSNSDGDTIKAVDASQAFSDANGDTLTYTASGLPQGLTISSTGMITGTVAGNAAPKSYAVTVTATDDKGAATTETFTWQIADVPPTKTGTLANQTYTDGQANVSIATSQGFGDANGNALTYGATGLPAGLTINATTGQITGTLDHAASKAAPSQTGSGATLDGKYTVTVTASDGLGGSAVQSFTIDAKNQAPVVGTTTANQSNSDGDVITAVNAAAAFSDPNGDTLTYTATGLPPGLSISTVGSITGTVAKNATPGSYSVTVTATDDKGATTPETFTWQIADVPPAQSGTLANQTFNDGQGNISIATSQGFSDANGNTLTYGATGLPAGLTIDPATGKITGTIDPDASKNGTTTSGKGATLDGTYDVTITATDGFGGAATQTFTIDSKNQAPVVGTITANQSNSDGDTINSVNAAAAFSDPNNDALTYTASNLPNGLTITSAGSITGTVAKNAQPGDYSVIVTAMDDKGATTSETFTWTIKDVPPTTNGVLANKTTIDGQTGISIATSQAFAPSNGNALTYSANGLPAGLSIDATTGTITGTIDHDASKNAPKTSGAGATLDGTYTVSVTAADGLGGTAVQSFTLDSTNTAPVVGTATPNQSDKTGQTIANVDVSKAFSDPNGDPLTYSAFGLPKGLTIDPSTGIVSGTVAADAKPGSYAVRILATDDKGAATREAVTWTVTDTPPTSAGTLANETYADATAKIDIATAGAFTSPNGLALTYAATGLPKGLSIDPGTGVITGQIDHDASLNAPKTAGSGATLDGTYAIVVTASDGQGGTAQQTFTIDATNNAPTLVAQTPDQTSADGQKVSLDGAKPFQDINTGDTFTYAATGLPTGLTIDPNTGLVSGTIDPHASRSGPFSVTVTITDDKGAATSESFTWGVADVPPTATPALPNQAVNDGTAVTVATAGGFTNPNNVAYTYSETGLPKGLSIDPNTGLISGTIDHDASTGGQGGVYAVTVTANDGQGGTATSSFDLTSSNQAPVVGTKTAGQGSLDGDTITPVDTSKAFSDPNGDPLTYAASALPAGLVIDPKTGIVSGTVSPSAAAGAYTVAVTATDDKGLATTESFGWTIGSVPPQPNGTIASQIFTDGKPGISIATASAFSDRNNNTLTYSATGLPAGLAIDPATGQITGTLDHDASTNAPKTSGAGATLDGTYTIVVTAQDGIGGSAVQGFTIDATNQAPAIATNTPKQSNTDGDVVSVNAGEAFLDPNTGDIVTYTAGTLPAGLTIDAKTGVISGTLQNTDYTSSPYAISVTATDDKNASTTETFTWVIKPADPTVFSPIPNVASFDGNTVKIETADHYATDGATIYTVSGLPKGLAIDATTGVISGTIDHDASAGTGSTRSGQITNDVYSVTVTATNASNASTAQTFALDVSNQAPLVGTVTANQSNKDGDAIAAVEASPAFSDPNGDPLTYSASNLPPGLTIDAATGRITGTVAGSAYPGDYKVTVTATDDKGAAAGEVFTWTIADVPPTTNGALAGQKVADGTTGISIATAGGFTPTNGNALYYDATGLPAGLTIDPKTGVISGAIDHDASEHAPTMTGMGASLDGTYAITVTAHDGLGGSATQSFAFDATNTAPANVAPTADQQGQDRQTVSLATGPAFSDANGDTLTFAASNLPTGLAIDPATGLISGTIDPAASVKGPYAVTVTATDDKGASTTETFRWAVADLAPQATPPLGERSINDGTAVSYATAGGFSNPNAATLTYSATGLPKGLSIDPATGVISGTLDHDASAAVKGGVYNVSVTVDDGQGGTAINPLQLVASNQAPVVTTPLPNQSSHDGDAIAPVDASKAFTDPNPGDTLSYVASNLPKGLAIDAKTGIISGTIAGNAAPGSDYVTVTATDDKGAATPATFTWYIGDVPPTAKGTLAAQHFTDSQNGIVIATAAGFTSPNGLPLTYSATGLPTGLTIDPQTGAITGFVSHNASLNAPTHTGMGATLDGFYHVVVTADDGQGGSVTQSFTLDSSNQAPTLGTPTADQRGADGQALSINAGKSFADPNTGDILTFAASGLPTGLTIDPATGTITGTIDPRASASGPYTVTVTATDNKGAATPETFHIAVDEVPPTAGTAIAATGAPDGTTITPLATASHFNSPNGLPLTYAATGLPAGLSIDPATGQISGTLNHDASKNAPFTTGAGATLDGTYSVVVSASDGQGGVATQGFTFDATNAAPAIVAQTADQHGTDGQAVSLDASKAFTDPNTGDVLAYAASGLPQGLSIDPKSGLITGTIDRHASATTPYAVTVTATDDKGAPTSETFAWTVADLPPNAGTIADSKASDGAAVSIQTAGGFTDPNGIAPRYSATGLPAGLAIDPNTGVISGTLSHDASIGNSQGAGLYTIVVTASDGQGGNASDTFHLTTSNQSPMVGTPTADQSSADGATIAPVDASKAFSDPNGDPLTYAAGNLPAGLAIDPTSGLITGTVAGNAKPGPSTVTVTATDDKGAATVETFTWTIGDVPPTTQGKFAAQGLADGQAGVVIETAGGFSDANGNALTYAASGLPAGLSIDPATGRITGTVDHDASKNAPVTSGSGATLDGTYTVTITATDGLGGSAVQSLTLDARNAAPMVGTPTADQSNADGATIAPVDASKAFSDPNGDPLTYAAANLPAGLSIDPTSGLITGTVAGNARPGTSSVTVTATDDKGAATVETFTWTIGDVPPTTQGKFAGQGLADGQAGISIDTAQGFSDANGNALTYAATGLPAGLSIDPATGRITGTVDHDASKNAPATTGSGGTLDGTYTVTITASDGLGGSAVQSFTIDARNAAPVVGTPTADQSNVDGATIAPVDASKAFSDPNGDPLTYAAANLPADLSIDPTSGLITGMVAGNARPGPSTVTVTATDDKGAATAKTFTWTIGDVPPTTQGALAAQGLADGQAGISIDTAQGFSDANGNALTYAASGLPAGLSIDPATGRITGTVDHDASKNAPATTGSGGTLVGTYTATITATDAFGGVAVQTLTLASRNDAPVVGMPTADQSNTVGDAVLLDTGKAFSDPNTGDVLTYAASGLPAGLSIDPRTGLVTGTVSRGDDTTSPYAVVVTATDDKGGASTETLSWTILPVAPGSPSVIPDASAFDGAAVSIDTASHFVGGASTTYAATGLPAGLSIDHASGLITGTVDHDASKNAPARTGSGATLDGLYTVAVTATNAGGSSTKSFTLDSANQAPLVGTKTADQANRDGDVVTRVDASTAFADPNGDPLTYVATNLPAGLAIDPATGRIGGTVAGNAQPGIYQIAVTATDDKGAATVETFTWTIGTTTTIDVGPVADGTTIAPFDTASAFGGNPQGAPRTYAANGLPAGLTLDPATGIVSGMLDRDASLGGDHGTYTITITSSDGHGGTAAQVFTLEATNQPPTLLAATPDQTGAQGQPVAPLDASTAFADPNGDPLTYGATNLPAGLAIDPATGRIGGTVAGDAQPGSYQVLVTATDDKGAATTETFAWTIGATPPAVASPTIDIGSVAEGRTIEPFATAASFPDPAGSAQTYAASGLPAGLTLDPATGLVTGTLDHDASLGGDHGTYTIEVTASDGHGGTATRQFTLEAIDQPPILVAPTPDQTGAQGQPVVPVDASKAFADADMQAVLTYSANGLPKGLAIDPATGLVSGTIAPDAASGDYAVTVTATDDKGVATPETFHFQVGELSPLAASLPTRFYGDGQSGIAIATADGFSSPNGLPLGYSASGLPAGLSIDPSSGLISGTLDRNASLLAPVKLGSGATFEGIYAVTVTATDPFGGTISQVFAIEVGHGVPAIAVPTADQHGRAGQAIAPLDLGAAFAGPAGDTLTYAANGLPPGLAFDPATGRVTGIIDPALASPRVYAVTVTATDTRGDSVAESFLYAVDTVPPSILTPQSFFLPAVAGLLPNTIGANAVRIADLGHERSVQPATPVLDVINQTSGDEERARVIELDGIVVSTVNGIAPLNGLQKLSEPGTGIVRSGAAADERGDRFDRTQSATGRGLEALSTPLTFLGATSIDIRAAGEFAYGPPINIETMLRDRLLSISVGTSADNGAGPRDPIASVRVTLADGRPLPGWLHADKKGFVFGKVPGGVDHLDLKVTSTSASGAISERSVTIHTDRGTITPIKPAPQAAPARATPSPTVSRTLSQMVAASHHAPADYSRIARLLD